MITQKSCSWASSFSIAIILSLFSSSKLPVGSSAKITFDPVARALPMATLYCSPPDKLDG